MRESKRGPVQKCSWTPEEDQILMNLVSIHGPKKWSLIAASLRGRIGKQCRERWHNHLNPEVRKDAWSPQEDALIFELVDKHGTKWATISKALPGRTDNSIKNRYYSSLKKFHEQRRQSTDVGPVKPPPKPKRRKSMQSTSSDTVSETCSEDAQNMVRQMSDDMSTIECSPKNLVGRPKSLSAIPNISHMFSLNSMFTGNNPSISLLLPQGSVEKDSQPFGSIDIPSPLEPRSRVRRIPRQRRLLPLHRVHSQALVHQALNINKLYEIHQQIASSSPSSTEYSDSTTPPVDSPANRTCAPAEVVEAQRAVDLLEPLSLEVLLHHF